VLGYKAYKVLQVKQMVYKVWMAQTASRDHKVRMVPKARMVFKDHRD
jgi:hypothetical protein